jgi:prepilin-type N-terminal cleavage/methylation domain-containing protein
MGPDRLRSTGTAPGTGRDPVRLAGEAGFSLMEVMVTMGVMSVVLALSTTGIVRLYAAQNSTDALASATGQIHIAFVRLDRDIRYASAVSLPGAGSSGAEYVEYLITNTGTSVCHQLRLTPSGRLEARREIGGTSPTGWNTMASQLVEPMSFVRRDASPGARAYQQLVISLSTSAGGTGRTARGAAAFTFTALNTSTETAGDAACNGMGRP